MLTQDIEVDGYRVKAGTVCAVGVYAMHRDPALWDHPLEFDPRPVHPENAKTRDRWQYIPFGAGPRTCIGDHFAMLEATLALATIIRRSEIRSLDDDFPLALPFTMVAAAPIRAQVKARTPCAANSEPRPFRDGRRPTSDRIDTLRPWMIRGQDRRGQDRDDRLSTSRGQGSGVDKACRRVEQTEPFRLRAPTGAPNRTICLASRDSRLPHMTRFPAV